MWLSKVAQKHTAAMNDKRSRFPGMPSIELASGKGLLSASDVRVTWVFTDVEVRQQAGRGAWGHHRLGQQCSSTAAGGPAAGFACAAASVAPSTALQLPICTSPTHHPSHFHQHTQQQVPAPANSAPSIHPSTLQGSTELWEWNPVVMGRAIELHNAALRGLLEEHCGHEVRTDGDSFTLAFHDGVDAVKWCLQVGPGWLTVATSVMLLGRIAGA